MWEERSRPLHYAPRPVSARADRRRRGGLRGRGPLEYGRRRDAEHPGKPHRHGVPGAYDVTEPGADHRTPAYRNPGAAPEDEQATGQGPRRRIASDRRNIRRRAQAGGLSAPVQRRDEAARYDRHGAELQSEADNRGRAYDGARRDDSGADSGAHAGPRAGLRNGHDHNHPQPGGRRPLRRQRQRHVRGQDHRDRVGSGDLPQPQASLHSGPAQFGPKTGRLREDQTRRDRGAASRPRQSGRRLFFRAQVQVRVRKVHRRIASTGGRLARTHHGLLETSRA